MTAHELKALTEALDKDHAEVHAAHAGARGAAKKETVSSATSKALAAGISLKDIFAAIMAALAGGGSLPAIIAAILALLTKQP